jgi:hypothetical protein
VDEVSRNVVFQVGVAHRLIALICDPGHARNFNPSRGTFKTKLDEPTC